MVVLILILLLIALLYFINNHISKFNDKKVFLNSLSGLGDRILTLIGFMTVCKYTGCTPVYRFSCVSSEFRCYDERLMKVTGIELPNDGENEYTSKINHNGNPNTVSPRIIYEYLKTKKPEITYEEVSKEFERVAQKQIGFSEIITSKIPNGLNTAYGIHLRKSDKIRGSVSGDIFTTEKDLETIIECLVNDIAEIMSKETNVKILVVSESTEWKQEVEGMISKRGKCEFIQLDYGDLENEYTGFSAVLDLACLSKCKKIFKGLNYSGFTILAAILGNVELVEYSDKINNYDETCTRAYDSVLNKRDYSLIDNKCISQFLHDSNNIFMLD